MNVFTYSLGLGLSIVPIVLIIILGSPVLVYNYLNNKIPKPFTIVFTSISCTIPLSILCFLTGKLSLFLSIIFK